MLRRTLLLILTFACLSATPLLGYSQTIASANGVAWLKGSQNPDGSWYLATSSTTTFYATTEVLDALATLGERSQHYSNGISSLQTQTFDTISTTYLAPKLKQLSSAGIDETADLSLLLSYKNADGGWGGYLTYTSTNFHAALALQALQAANYPDLSVSNTALAFLTNAQNTDGGFGFSSGDDSGIFMTAIVAATLEQYQQTATIANALTKAIAYLSLRQNTDGGFGAPASTVYETALAYTALVGSGQASATAMQNALAYLSTTQSANGSWNDDPYSTALALKALYLSEHIPTPPPAAATTGAIMGTIVDDTTKKPLSGVAVSLTTNPSISTTTDANGLFSLSGIPAGSQQIP